MDTVSDVLKNFSKLSIINLSKPSEQSTWKSRRVKLFYIVRSLLACAIDIIAILSHLNSFLTKECYTEIIALNVFVMLQHCASWAAYCYYNLYGKKIVSLILQNFDDIHYRILKHLDVNVTISHHRKIINALIIGVFIMTIYLEIFIISKHLSRIVGSFLSFLTFIWLNYHNLMMFLWPSLLILLENILIYFICIELAGLTSIQNPWTVKFKRVYHQLHYDIDRRITDAFGFIVLSFVYYCFGKIVLATSAGLNPQYSCILKHNPLHISVAISSVFLLSILEFGEYGKRKVSI